MIQEIFQTVIYKPLYNLLAVILGIIPGAHVGYAIIILTLLVRTALLPFSHKSVTSQKKIQSLDGRIKAIREKHPDKQEQAAQIMALYKEHGVNPFSGCLFLFIQIPIILALYWVFGHGLTPGTLNPTLLYSFVHAPEAISYHFLSLNLLEKNIFLAFLAGLTQFFQMKLSLPPTPKTKEDKKNKDGVPEFSEEFKNALAVQSRYVLPGMIFIFGLQFAAAISLYWITNNLFSIAHEYWVAQQAKKLIREAKAPQG